MDQELLVESTRMGTIRRHWAWHGWLGLVLVAVFWPLNWLAPGLRTLWAFLPLWVGYALVMDALVLQRKGTSLITRSWRRFAALYIVSIPTWWLFEVFNWRVQSWHYLGTETLSPFSFFIFASINFSTVIPAVFEAAELASTFGFIRKAKTWMVIRGDRRTVMRFFLAGWIMLALMLAWPRYFYPFLWLSVFFILEPINIWLGNRSLTRWLEQGDWRPVYALWIGVWITAFFWEMWNYFGWPKWVYSVPGVSFLHVFEMPLIGYLGYLPFSLELFAVYHLAVGLVGEKHSEYVQIAP